MFKIDTSVIEAAKERAKAVDLTDFVNKERDAFNGNGVLTSKIWEETIQIQKEFNDSVSLGWEKSTSPNNFWMAILDETIEVLSSKHWKWWKDKQNFNKIDWNNVTVELTDIFLFMLSQAIREGHEEIIYVTLASFEASGGSGPGPTKIRDEDFFEDFWSEFLMSVTLKSLPLTIVKWVEFWVRAGGTIESLIKDFRIKAVLNDVRQEFGYANGSYIKNWNGKEDNVVVWEIARSSNLILDETFREVLKEKVREYYLIEVAI